MSKDARRHAETGSHQRRPPPYRHFPRSRHEQSTHNLLIMGKCKREEEREFYLRLAHAQQWHSRDLERQISGSLFASTGPSTPSSLSS
jgi:hypothetical protein